MKVGNSESFCTRKFLPAKLCTNKVYDQKSEALDLSFDIDNSLQSTIIKNNFSFTISVAQKLDSLGDFTYGTWVVTIILLPKDNEKLHKSDVPLMLI